MAIGFAAGELAEQAAKSALDQAGMSSAATALVMASAACGPEMSRVSDVVCGVLGTNQVVGASMSGLFSGGRLGEHIPAVGVLAFEGLDAEPFAITDVRGDEARIGAELLSQLNKAPGAHDLVLAFPDAQRLLVRPLIAGMREHLAPATLLGAGALGAPGHASFQWRGRDVFSEGVAGLILRLRHPVRMAIAHSFKPSEIRHEVTRCEGAWVLSLDGRPALGVYREHAREPLAEDVRRAAARLRVCRFPRRADVQEAPCQSVMGFDERRSAFALPEFLDRGDQLSFVVHEATAAREQLESTLDHLGADAPGLGMVFSAQGRGASLFGETDLEASLFERRHPGAALLGMQGAFAVGPNGAASALGAHDVLPASAVIALLSG